MLQKKFGFSFSPYLLRGFFLSIALSTVKGFLCPLLGTQGINLDPHFQQRICNLANNKNRGHYHAYRIIFIGAFGTDNKHFLS